MRNCIGEKSKTLFGETSSFLQVFAFQTLEVTPSSEGLTMFASLTVFNFTYIACFVTPMPWYCFVPHKKNHTIWFHFYSLPVKCLNLQVSSHYAVQSEKHKLGRIRCSSVHINLFLLVDFCHRNSNFILRMWKQTTRRRDDIYNLKK